ncbi:MAG: M48 family metalloprotease [Haloarculaceae archaeon]
MRRPWLRGLMAVVGLSLFGLYLLASLGLLLLVEWMLAVRTSAVETVLLLAVTVLVVGYGSYRLGTARLLRGIDAVPLARHRAPGVHRRLDRLVERMDVGRPDLLVADMGAPNALSLGTGSDGTIVLDRRLPRLLTADELEGILAHELAHAESYDSLVKTLVVSTIRTLVALLYLLLLPAILLLTGIARAIAWLGGRPGAWRTTVAGNARTSLELLVVVVLSVLTLATLAHSRKREFAADERAVEVTGRPLALAGALEKIDRAATSPWDALSPLYTRGREDGTLREVLSSHPPVDERIDRLLDLSDRRRVRIAG